MAAILNIIAYNIGSQADRNAIPMANPIFQGQEIQQRHYFDHLVWAIMNSKNRLPPHKT